VKLISNIEHILALPQDVFRLAIVNRGWRQQAYPALGQNESRFVQPSMAVSLRGDSEALDRRMLAHVLSGSSACRGSRGASCQLSRYRRSKDWELMAIIRSQDYTFVTNNRSDFPVLHGKEPLHAGVIIIFPSVTPIRQRELFSAALAHVGARDLTNTVVEVNSGTTIKCSEYALPEADEQRT
jgi:hypothetical protein